MKPTQAIPAAPTPAGFRFWPPAQAASEGDTPLSTWPPAPRDLSQARAAESRVAPDTFVANRTPGQRSQAARTIQRIWRGHHSRAQSRQAGLQAELVAVSRRQAELYDLGARLPEGVGLHPALLGEGARGGKKRKRGLAAEAAPTPPCEMNVDQRLQRLKEMGAALWGSIERQVTATHPEVLLRAGDRQLNADGRRRLLAQVRDDLFVQALPEDACAQAGFFSPTRQQLTLRRRCFTAPRGDLLMRDG